MSSFSSSNVIEQHREVPSKLRHRRQRARLSWDSRPSGPVALRSGWLAIRLEWLPFVRRSTCLSVCVLSNLAEALTRNGNFSFISMHILKVLFARKWTNSLVIVIVRFYHWQKCSGQSVSQVHVLPFKVFHCISPAGPIAGFPSSFVAVFWEIHLKWRLQNSLQWLAIWLHKNLTVINKLIEPPKSKNNCQHLLLKLAVVRINAGQSSAGECDRLSFL